MTTNALNNKGEFIINLKKNVDRYGVEELIEYLENGSDFFTAPASTRYHGSYEGGLCEHSLNVYYALKDEMQYIYGSNWNEAYSLESVTLVSLLHDLCKIDRYIPTIKSVKDDITGQWKEVLSYKYNDESFCMGHSALSLQRIQKFIRLSDIESQAIFWHMGPYDLSQYNSMSELNSAYKNNTLAFALNRADMMATYIIENDRFKPV